MTETSIGSRLGRVFSEEQMRKLRYVGKAELLRAGCPLDQLTHKEVDRWLESRLEETLERYLRLGPKL